MSGKHAPAPGDGGPDHVLASAWRALGLLLGALAFFAVSVSGVLQSGEPVLPVTEGLGAFLLLWSVNRILARALGLDAAPTQSWEEPLHRQDESGGAQ